MSGTILVVDDNLPNRLVAEGYLQAAGYEVLLAEDGEAGISCFERHGPDLVLLDVLMPGLNGFEVCRRIRALPRGEDVPIVFLTALSDHGSYEDALASGADDFLTKPIRQTELLLRVRSLMRIRRLQRELEERNRALLCEQEQRRRLSAMIVHDLKSPLATQVLNLEYLQQLELPEEAAEAIDDVVAATGWMERMILELLDVYRAEDAALRPLLEACRVTELVDEARSMVHRLAVDAGLQVEVRVVPEDLVIEVDRDLFRRVLANLLDNCAKYAPRHSRVQVHVETDQLGTPRILIADEGPGIPEDQREVVFELYSRLEVTERRPSRGLGLAFCRLAVEAHGGRIRVSEVPGLGTPFEIVLPLRA